MDRKERGMDTPLSRSSVTLKLEMIQQRCSELMDEPDGLTGLTLEEPVVKAEPGKGYDPYGS